ncbi:MAG: hypothetical protein Q8O91_11790 [Candidatus Aminicenantes bacterium]|nr:hypothetical protein [Candidatus Aminicenantes bacterium]
MELPSVRHVLEHAGTVIYSGYGSAFERVRWNGSDYVESDRFLETKRGFFFKVSYLGGGETPRLTVAQFPRRGGHDTLSPSFKSH